MWATLWQRALSIIALRLTESMRGRLRASRRSLLISALVAGTKPVVMSGGGKGSFCETFECPGKGK